MLGYNHGRWYLNVVSEDGALGWKGTVSGSYMFFCPLIPLECRCSGLGLSCKKWREAFPMCSNPS